jgi:hypothetical protein
MARYRPINASSAELSQALPIFLEAGLYREILLDLSRRARKDLLWVEARTYSLQLRQRPGVVRFALPLGRFAIIALEPYAFLETLYLQISWAEHDGREQTVYAQLCLESEYGN